MRSNRYLVGKRVAQALVAFVLAFVVIEGALAADTCECPACPAHACMHLGCPSSDDGANCATVSSTACRDGIVMPLAPMADGFILLYGVPAVSIAAIREGGAAWDTVIGRRALAPRIASPPAHIVFCRLRR